MLWTRGASVLVLLILLTATAAPAADSGWRTLTPDPPALIAPLDLQYLPGKGEEPSLIALIDPGSNSCKVRTYDLDGHPVANLGPANGPDPWNSGLRPFSAFTGPQLPLAASRGGAFEAIQTEDEILNVLSVDPATGLLMPLHGGRGDATHPGEVPQLPFDAALWGVDPASGLLYFAGDTGVYRYSGGEGQRLAVPVREDWLHLEVAPDGTVALLSGPSEQSLQLTGRLFRDSGIPNGEFTAAADLSGTATILDQANLGAESGFVICAIIAPPWPVSLTQYLNDETRELLKTRGPTPFLFRFDWSTGGLAALTPLPDLPDDLELVRVSGDATTTLLLMRSRDQLFLRMLTSRNFTAIGDIPLELGHATLPQPAGLLADPAGTQQVLDEARLPGELVPLLTLRSLGNSPTHAPITTLIPLPPGSRFDVGGLNYDTGGTLWWGGQVIDAEGVRGSLWQRQPADDTHEPTDLFTQLPQDLFDLGAGNSASQLPWLLAQTQLSDGSWLALAGTFKPPATHLLHLAADSGTLLEEQPLPGDFDPLAYGDLCLFTLSDGALILGGRGAETRDDAVWLRQANGTTWKPLDRLVTLGAWPLGAHPNKQIAWLIRGLGLVSTSTAEEILAIAPNSSPFLPSLTASVFGPDSDALLIRDLGEVWQVNHSAYVPLKRKSTRELNEAQLALADAIKRYYLRQGNFPPAITRAFLGADLQDYTWEGLWEHFIGGRPLLYHRAPNAYDLLVWNADESQAVIHLSEAGIEAIDPQIGYVTAQERSQLTPGG